MSVFLVLYCFGANIHLYRRFLKYEPWSDFAFFRSMITIPFLSRDPKAIEIVQIILKSILILREKTMIDRDGNMIVVLPDKEVCCFEF